MTTDPEVQALLVTCKDMDGETTLSRGVRLIENHDPSCVNDNWKYDPLVRLSDYEDLKIAYEEELFRVRQDRDRHHGAVIRAVGQIAALQDEIEKLRKDAEFGRSILSKREPGKKYGCHCDIEEGVEPDECVIDMGTPHHCIYAKRIQAKEQCEYWRVIASDSTM